MDKEACKKRFYELVYPSLPNEWEVDTIVEDIVELPSSVRELMFTQIPVIWPVSNSLCLSFLEDGSRVIKTIPADLVPKWVRAILRRYEQHGLAGARELIANAGQSFLAPLKKRNMVCFEDVSKRMLFYLRGISGENVDIAFNPVPYTNTTTFYIPTAISLLGSYKQNQLLYKSILTIHWGFIFLGTFRIFTDSDLVNKSADVPVSKESEHIGTAKEYFSGFEHPQLAADLFFLLETHKVMHWMKDELPGLANELRGLEHELSIAVNTSELDAAGSKLTELGCFLLFNGDLPDWLPRKEIFAEEDVSDTSQDVFFMVRTLYRNLAKEVQNYMRPPLLELLGTHDFSKASVEIERKRSVMKETFIFHLEALRNKEVASPDQKVVPSSLDEGGKALAILTEAGDETQNFNLRQVLDNPEMELPEELETIIEQIKADLGHIPPSYFSAADGISGGGFDRRDSPPTQGKDGLDSKDGILFDEWDYRRNGYRENWCRIYEKELPLLHSTFVDATLAKHQGLLHKLRRQFEFMKTNEHFVRRQREGDDLDLDAIVEARGDQRAGLSPSSKLFVRLQRNERDIATIFLVDMSNSTEGWVGNVIKEALVLLCEVMDVSGDPYGILGFSGMRRSRCDIYRIKDLGEPYDQQIHRRINSILPREYTRMGPALRYAFSQLKLREARTRLLVTITDGKPEDYDDYKGDYAIEDTKKALMEARGAGIHTFCITVDREAQEYLPQMFGMGNYIFIDDIAKLPVRMIDMYRLLTS